AIETSRIEKWQVLVAFGEDGIGERPLNGHMRIVPTQAARELGEIELGHLVEDLAVVGKALEAVGDSARDIQSTAIFIAQLKALPLAEGRGIAAHIHKNVENGACGAADEFDLRFGVRLKMHAADHGALFGQGEVALRP